MIEEGVVIARHHRKITRQLVSAAQQVRVNGTGRDKSRRSRYVLQQRIKLLHRPDPQYQEATAALATKWEQGEVAKRIRVLRQLESHLHTNVNEGLALEVCFIEAFGA
jgi:hypothetical protein